ncbi:major facilitator superfamily domain-containing protein 2B isoform X5 [Choloepus didactylus]|uniref:major facilitator superfamily domain-containing protein 2B isoform X5 n=1 Tax=Choloepus didactylus TaxID=27675 RepID=UPI00189EA05D|nr:major facilitator superfamily domain-containing protein 2B isoform X5 [Choloepus didactylus]
MEGAPGRTPDAAVEALPPAAEAHTSESDSVSRDNRLSFCTKLCYGIGGVPNQVASSAIAFYLQLFLLDVAQIPAAQVSLVLFGGKVSGAAADPVAGFFINRSRRTGARRLMPWVLGCTPFLALAYFFLWFLPPFTALHGLWYATFYCLFQALATAFQVPYTALTMFLTPCPRERDSATAYRMTMEMVGTLVGAAAHGLIVSGAHKPGRCPEAALPGPVAVAPDATRLYCIAATVVAVTYPVCSCLLYLGVKKQPDAPAPASGPGLGFLAGLGRTVRHPPYLKLVVSFLLISAAVQVEQGYLVLFCTHASRLHGHIQGLVLTILVYAAGCGGRLPAAALALAWPRPGDHLLLVLRLFHQAFGCSCPGHLHPQPRSFLGSSLARPPLNTPVLWSQADMTRKVQVAEYCGGGVQGSWAW